MKTVRRLLYADTLKTIAYVMVCFLALFAFLDLFEELGDIGALKGYKIGHALAVTLLAVPAHVYDLLPIATLIGAVLVLAKLARNSEFTILRTSGLTPFMALRMLLLMGAGLTVLTLLVGDYVAPAATQKAKLIKARFQGAITLGATGAWLREAHTQSGGSAAVNVRALSSQGALQDVRVFEFDAQGRLLLMLSAQTGQFGPAGWQLHNVQRRDLSAVQTSLAQRPKVGKQAGKPEDAAFFAALAAVAKPDTPALPTVALPQFTWPTALNADMVRVALFKPETMSTLNLYTYKTHLQRNQQNAQRYDIEFWRKVFYPLSCLVMVVLALPFAYLHFRNQGVSSYVFMGVLGGISFYILNNAFGFIGNLNQWQPWLAAALPSLIYSVVALGAFAWLVSRQ